MRLDKYLENNQVDNFLGMKCYSLTDMQKHFDCKKITENDGYLISKKYESLMDFAVMYFCTEDDENGLLLESMWNGSGTLGSLRELRHSFMGDPENHGYIFYMNGDLIINAIKELRNHFDF